MADATRGMQYNMYRKIVPVDDMDNEDGHVPYIGKV